MKEVKRGITEREIEKENRRKEKLKTNMKEGGSRKKKMTIVKSMNQKERNKKKNGKKTRKIRNKEKHRIKKKRKSK